MKESYPSGHDRAGVLVRVLGKLTKSDGISIPRMGGGVRVAVIPFDSENPDSAIERTIELRRARENCPMPFDESDYVLDSYTPELP
jgi:hypothetical protein